MRVQAALIVFMTTRRSHAAAVALAVGFPGMRFAKPPDISKQGNHTIARWKVTVYLPHTLGGAELLRTLENVHDRVRRLLDGKVDMRANEIPETEQPAF